MSAISDFHSTRRRYTPIALLLPSLPPELVHQILDNLEISKILELICLHSIPYIDTCVSSHLHLGVLFPASLLPETKKHVTLYLTIMQRHRASQKQFLHDLLSLHQTAVTFLNLNRNSSDVLGILKASIIEELVKYEPYIPLLQTFSGSPIPTRNFWDTSTISALDHIFFSLDTAESTLNRTKYDQLGRMVELLQKNPGMLKVGNDPSQEHRNNTQHRIDCLLEMREKVLKPQIIDGLFTAVSIFNSHRFYLVPYDRFLRLFLKILHRFPSTAHTYPNQLGEVLDGFAYIYLRNKITPEETPPIPRWRTLYSIYSATAARAHSGGVNQPQFTLNSNDFEHSHLLKNGNEFHPLKKVMCNRIRPADERELIWLEAFIAVCKHMSEMQELWTHRNGEDVTVAKYWETHVG